MKLHLPDTVFVLFVFVPRTCAHQEICEGQHRAENQRHKPSLHRGVQEGLPAEGDGAIVLPEGDEVDRPRGPQRMPLPPQGESGGAQGNA